MPGWPDALTGYSQVLAYWASRRKERNLPTPTALPRKPRGILLHSGDHGPGTAQWAWKKEAKYWAHFAFDSKSGLYVQTDYLTSWAPHGGGLNQYSIGIETPHFPGCPDKYKDLTIKLVSDLIAALGIEWITCHRFIEAKKQDPSKDYVKADWFVGLPLRLYWGKITIHDILVTEGLD